MIIKTIDLTGPALDWAVAKCEGSAYHGPAWTKYSTDWSQGGPIIEREGISVWVFDDVTWKAQNPFVGVDCVYEGDTLLIAAMRCYVASNLGDEIDVPNELI